MAVSDLRADDSYHLSVTIEAPPSLRATVAGLFEVDIEGAHDRERVVRIVNGREVSRTIRVGPTLVYSKDRGKTWRRLPDELAQTSPSEALDRLLEPPCRVEGSPPRLTVLLRSKTGTCDEATAAVVTLEAGRVASVETKREADVGTISYRAVLDLDRSVEPISMPDVVEPASDFE